MPAPKKGPKFGGSASHQKALLANLATSLFINETGFLVTTEAKAKALRPYAEKLITSAKKGGVHRQRLVVAQIKSKDAAYRLLNEIGPRYSDRNGGYPRTLSPGSPPGD